MFSILIAIIYLTFISLGLPDSLLGSAWPSMYLQLDAPLSYAGIISMIIALSTVVSSLKSDAVTRKLGTGRVTAISVAMTAVALFGFSISSSFIVLCLWAVPYGLGAGSVDVTINNYVAIHYESKHMSWLHCMWGVGATIGPYIMGLMLTGGRTWNSGYRFIALIQVVFSAMLFLSIPLWTKATEDKASATNEKPLSLKALISISGVKAVMLFFFCYCAVEQTAGLWATSYLNISRGISSELAASLGGIFFLGITFGRAISGFISIKLGDDKMVWLGICVISLGCVALLIPSSTTVSVAGLILIGLGCAPIYPSIIHSTPYRFGAERSQAIIGVQMASSYMGTCLMPPIFGLLAEHISISLLPIFLLLFLFVALISFRSLRSIDAA